MTTRRRTSLYKSCRSSGVSESSRIVTSSSLSSPSGETITACCQWSVEMNHVAAIVDRVMTTIDRNPELVHSLSEAVQDVGAGAGDMVGEAGEAVLAYTGDAGPDADRPRRSCGHST